MRAANPVRNGHERRAIRTPDAVAAGALESAPVTLSRMPGVPLLCIGLAMAGAVACGAPGLPPEGPLRAGTASAPRGVNVIIRDYLFEPTPIRLVRGETVRFNIVNGGLLPHDFVLGGAAVQAAWASAEAIATHQILAATAPPVSLPPELAGLRVYLTSGQSSSVVFRVPEEGELLLACHIPGHLEKGMVGVVEYVPAASE